MRIGFANGCFDKLHQGHRFFLEYAREYCDWLIVAVNADYSVRGRKGPERPFLDLHTRIRDLRSTMLVDAIIPFSGDPGPLLQQIRPDVLLRGEDQTTEGYEYAGKFIRIPRLQGFSTTALAGRKEGSNASK